MLNSKWSVYIKPSFHKAVSLRCVYLRVCKVCNEGVLVYVYVFFTACACCCYYLTTAVVAICHLFLYI